MIDRICYILRKYHRPVVAVLLVVLCFTAAPAFAQNATDTFGVAEVGDSIGLGKTDIRVTIAKIIRAALGLLGVVAVGIVLFGGFMYMTAGGSEDKVATAKKILTNGIIGLILVLSSFSIAHFVLSRLSQATGSGAVPGDITPNCTDPSGVCISSFDPKKDPPSCVEGNNFFIAESITPNQEKTGVNNVVIRAVFSKPLKTDASKVFEIFQNGSALPANNFSYAFVSESNKQVVEATYILPDGVCDGIEKNCLPENKKYGVKLLAGIQDESGKTLQNEQAQTVCGGGFGDLLKNGASFTVDKKANDGEKPAVEAWLMIEKNGKKEATKEAGIKIPVGHTYTAVVSAKDASGIAYVHAQMFDPNSQGKVIDEWFGPLEKSDTELKKEISFTLGSNVKLNSEFVLKFTAYDIDHKNASIGLNFVATGSTCGNGVKDGDETGVDTGGSCGAPKGGSCQTKLDCASGLQCVAGTCVPVPYITGVSPMDGASGNWITISGKHFGDKPGKVEFGVPSDDTKPFIVAENKWYTSEIVTCSDKDVSWSDTEIIVKVPDDKEVFVAGSKSVIRVTTADEKTDTTVDNIGFIPQPDGRFTKNTTKRPGLCKVISKTLTSFGKQKEVVHALGSGFGTKKEKVLFGNLEAPIVTWGDINVEAKIPSNIVPGPVFVQVEANGEKSNPKSFTVVSDDAAFPGPVIAGIDPQETTPKSYITISGSGLGENGVVYFNNNKNNNCPGDGCIPAIENLPGACGDTWTPKQVIVQVPETIPVGKTYYIVLENDSKLKTDGQIAVKIAAGPAQPSICALSPSVGPSPLPADHPGITITGANFSKDAIVYFFKKGGDVTNVATWFSSKEYPVVVSSKTTDTTIVTALPQKDGVSMPTGPIKVSVNNQLSNSYVYEAQDCTAAGSKAPGPDFQCCAADGPDKGIWKKDNQICQGDSRKAGYVWRFTTGIFNDIPKVVEKCVAKQLPSPSPWVSQGDGGNACRNAEIRVEFTVNMDQTTLNNKTVQVFTCGQGDKSDCSKKETTKGFSVNAKSGNFIEIEKSDDLLANTWYRVELLEGIKSYKEITIAGKKTVVKEPLLNTRPCGIGTAYCFEFKTGTGQCKISSVGVAPAIHKTSHLGVVQNPAWEFDNNIEKPQHPLIYKTWALGDQACTTVDTDGLKWTWTSPKPEAKIEGLVPTSSYAMATAFKHNAAGIDLKAETLYDQKNFSATSTLIIDLLTPKVLEYEPNCAESCINPRLRVSFNRDMNPQTYQGGFLLFKCSDANCSKTDSVDVQLDMTQSTKSELVAYAKLEAGTYYTVLVKNSIKAIGGVSATNEIISEQELTPFGWVFKTQDNATACAVGSVSLSPDPFTAYTIGQKAQYSATPFSSPNACGKYGQALNKWDYSYTWKSLDSDVASISLFPNVSVKEIHPACNIACLPRGSDILFDQNNPSLNALCGNAVLDPGEDCDIATLGETAGKSCALNCLRPGNSDKALCGNGIVEPQFGEMCDPKKEGETGFCTEDCRLTGSGSFDPTKVGASVCGDGKVTKGESCDIGIKNSKNDGEIFCSSQCLHEGTKASAYWCENSPLFGKNAECKTAVSVCGNARLEAEEECEFAGKNTTYRLGDLEKIVDIDPNILCSKNCRIQNACILTQIQKTDTLKLGGIWCEKGTPGCTSECRLAGSSPLYNTPSLCGDGKTGIGEYGQCETAKAPGVSGSSPVQVVTAEGKKQTDEKIQQTQIQVVLSATSTNFTATSTFALQCGYTEFDTPIVEKTKTIFNDCSNTEHGVSGISSCCLPRPVRKIGSEYPLNGSGFDGTKLACPNTAIFAVFNKELKEDTIAGNVQIARGFIAEKFNCASVSSSSIDITEQAIASIAYGSVEDAGLIQKLWNKVKTFVVRLFKMEAHADNISDTLNKYKTWCTVGGSVDATPIYMPPAAGETNTSTKLMVDIDAPLAPESVFMVVLKGGKDGIVDMQGVGIRNPNNPFTLNDVWAFKTKKEICKISTVTVEPGSYAFTSQSKTQQFLAVAATKDGEFIVPTTPYNWKWDWNPKINPVFNIPVQNTPSDKDTIAISPKGPQGKLSAVASAEVTEDVSAANNHKGLSFSGTTNLSAAFCENPWPEYVDKMFNMSFSYCPDAGKTANKADDLPFFTVLDVTNDNVGAGPSQCTLNSTGAEPKLCGSSADCNMELYNMPDDENPLCDKNVDAASIKKNACTVHNLTGMTGVCILNDGGYQYPPSYGETYRNCTQDSDCKFIQGKNKQELCLKKANWEKWKVVNNTCIAGEKKSLALDNKSLKKVLFVSDKSDDAIGLQIFLNPERKIIKDWFTSEFGGTGKTKPVPVAGYEGLTDGANIYVNALNVIKTDVHNNIYLFSINPDAQPDTKQVFEKILTSLAFNTNLTSYGFCRKAGSSSNENYGSIACSTDFDCLDPLGNPLPDTDGICSNDKAKFLRDWKRISEIKVAQDNLNKLKDKGKAYPDLKAGSYIPSYSTSKWSSWGELSKQIGGGLPVDPINKWLQCENTEDQETCWNATASTFTCPQKMSVYEYSFNSTTKNYTLHVPFEYFDFTNPNVKAQFTYPQFISHKQQCVPKQVYSAFGGSCGDSIVQPGEECDPAGKKLVTNLGVGSFGACAAGQFKEYECTTGCKWKETKACSAGGVCGNGKVEAGELCDDGVNNGKYGYCDAPVNGVGGCKGTSEAGFCGNGKIDFDDKNKNGVQEAGENNIEQCDFADAKYVNKDGYALEKNSSCSGSCTIGGQYCGDGLKQVDKGEECDDGNNANNDDCSATCKVEYALICLKQKPQFFVHNLTATTSLIYLSQVTKPVIEEKINSVPQGNIVSYSKNYFQSIASIEACRIPQLNGTQLCQAAGLTCKKIYVQEGSVVNGYNCITAKGTDYGLTGDAVWVECSGEYKPLVTSAATPDAPACGNSKIDIEAGEVCDEGSEKNGIACTPQYGKTCTYCAADCKKVLTVDPLAFCGNGKVDPGEACDFVGSKIYGTATTTVDGKLVTTQVEKTCLDVGAYECAAQCTQLVSNNCVLCGVKDGLPSVPKISLLNPMMSTFVGDALGKDFSIEIVRKDHPKINNTTNQKYGEYSYFALSPQSGYLWDIGSEGKLNSNLSVPFDGLDSLTPNSVGIQTSPLCNANGDKSGYHVLFNPSKFITTANFEDIKQALTASNKKLDAFPYPVSDQKGPVINDVILSPALPENNLRIVVKWKDPDLALRGALYYNYTMNFYSKVEGDKKLCGNIEQQSNGYFVPKVENGGCQPISVGAYFHPYTHTEKTHIQSFTIDMPKIVDDKNPIGFVVHAVGPIASHKTKDIQVEVYDYHTGQNPTYSVYAPTTTFHIIDAAETSTNGVAKYWHVFNIIKKDNKYQLAAPIRLEEGLLENGTKGMVEKPYDTGLISTGQCEVNKSIPGIALQPGC